MSLNIVRIYIVLSHVLSLKNKRHPNGNISILRKEKKNLKSSFSFLSSILINTNIYMKKRILFRWVWSSYTPFEVITLCNMLISTATT